MFINEELLKNVSKLIVIVNRLALGLLLVLYSVGLDMLDIGDIWRVNGSLLQQASYAGSVVMPAERDQDGSKTVTDVRL